jgi:hypothetical protein
VPESSDIDRIRSFLTEAAGTAGGGIHSVLLPLGDLRKVWDGWLPPELEDLPEETMVSVEENGVYVINDR